MSKMDRFERFLGSSMLSLLCAIVVLLSLDLPFWLYFAIMIPLINYTTKIEQIHRHMLEQAQ